MVSRIPVMLPHGPKCVELTEAAAAAVAVVAVASARSETKTRSPCC